MTQPRHVLIFTRTENFRHESIPNAIAALDKQTSKYNIDFTFSEDQDLFTDAGLGAFQAIVFLHNTGEILTESGKTALKTFIDNGGALVSIHSGCAALYSTDFFAKAVGANFDYHPKISTPTFLPVDRAHPATRHLPEKWTFKEEAYFFRSDPRDNGAKVILIVAPDSFDKSGGASNDPSFSHGDPHPAAWYQTRNAGASSSDRAGRSFLTALGHTREIWEDPVFLEHVMEGINWTLDRD